MSETRESGIGGRRSEPEIRRSADAPTLDCRLPTPAKFAAQSNESEPPPGGGAPTPHSPLPTPREPNWRLIYSAVMIELALLILIFYAFTKAFA